MNKKIKCEVCGNVAKKKYWLKEMKANVDLCNRCYKEAGNEIDKGTLILVHKYKMANG